MDNWLYVLKIAIASAIISALIKWVGPAIAPPESTALVLVLLPTIILGGWLLSRWSQP
ncbi:hypothetical protein N836_22805 [Leptolyngbya sp. Heron Island J]|uniref:hypothetical protein n=1 Tax=Leptolyngbya sp. Heron Island J TaxID=1385935 RepID=UPI0003B9D07D|nr:hypothetical protein [Leptolyngbya sp. Heron Island J]ESA33225.1 hypothetical protein N836_22805 [Leptolyngbya sp. Heron Island J]